MSYYIDTLCIIALLSCLFITSSFAGPVPNVVSGSQKLIPTQISSRDSKVSLSSTMKGLRLRPPSSYSLKLESFSTLMKSTYTERYDSRPFRVGKYNWYVPFLFFFYFINYKLSRSGTILLVTGDNITCYRSTNLK